MGIKSPTTYGDYYWAKQVEAQKLFADDSESHIAPYVKGLLGDIPLIDEFPTGMKTFIEGLREPTGFAFLPFMAGVGINAIDEALDIAFEPVMTALKRNYGKRFKSKWLTAAEVNLLWSRQKITEGLYDEVIAAEGYEQVLGNALYESALPYPTVSDLVLYSRYNGDPEAPWGEFQKWFNISPREWPVWKFINQQRLDTLQYQQLYKRGLVDAGELSFRLSEIGWPAEKRPLVQDLSYSLPNAMLMVQADLLYGTADAGILTDIAKADIHPTYAKQYLDAVLTKPASTDVIAYMLRQDPNLSGLDAELRKIGIHGDYWPLYKELAYQIPPVADIITMAVREAFTPAIAERFGQYEDFPDDLAEWAGKKGLKPEWAKRYWAAHWSLPSANQGFEMLHRGVIDETELEMLLRALDVMPFWRDKLIDIAYKRVTRVDVRRMYKTGVLTETEVYEANLELGYNERDAKRMTEFTVISTLQSLAKFTTTDVISAYTKRMIDRTEAGGLLRDLGVKSNDVSYILDTADYKRQWALTDVKVAGIKNLYKKRQYDADKAREQLFALDLPTEQIDALMDTWWYEIKAEPVRTWTTAQTVSFVKAGLITPARAVRELQTIGYDTEHINIYMQGVE